MSEDVTDAELEVFRSLSLNDVRRRGAEAERRARASPLGYRHYAGASHLWSRLERDMRRRGVWLIGEFDERRLRRWASSVHGVDPMGLDGTRY